MVVGERAISVVVCGEEGETVDDVLPPESQRIELPPVPPAVHERNQIALRRLADCDQRPLERGRKGKRFPVFYTSIAG